MKQILPQYGRASHSLFPPEPFLLLTASPIAGLLPARVTKEQSSDDHQFLYTNPGLATLPFEQRHRLVEATRTLLDVALGLSLWRDECSCPGFCPRCVSAERDRTTHAGDEPGPIQCGDGCSATGVADGQYAASSPAIGGAL